MPAVLPRYRTCTRRTVSLHGTKDELHASSFVGGDYWVSIGRLSLYCSQADYLPVSYGDVS